MPKQSRSGPINEEKRGYLQLDNAVVYDDIVDARSGENQPIHIYKQPNNIYKQPTGPCINIYETLNRILTSINYNQPINTHLTASLQG